MEVLRDTTAPVGAVGNGVRGAVEAFLRRRWRADVEVIACEAVEPWAVVRVETDAGSVIVKWVRDGQGERSDANQLAVEAAALDFVRESGFDAAPRLLAVDLDAGLLAMSAAPDGAVPLASRLVDGYGGEQTIVGLRSFAAALGRLHATVPTSGAEGFAAALARFGGRRAHDEWTDVLRRGWTATAAPAGALGVPLERHASREADVVLARLRDPGLLAAFSNGDAGVNNYLIHEDNDGTLIDYESAGFRYALLDVACLYVPGPAWLRTADPRRDGSERAYRDEAIRGVPALADDDVFDSGIAAAALAHAMRRAARFGVVDARRPGDPSQVQLVSLLECAASVAAERDMWPALGDWARRFASALRSRWPAADVDVDALAPYSPRVKDAA